MLPTEQRWSAASTTPLSPAHSDRPNDVFCWVGLIMYLPPSQSEVAPPLLLTSSPPFLSTLPPFFPPPFPSSLLVTPFYVTHHTPFALNNLSHFLISFPPCTAPLPLPLGATKGDPSSVRRILPEGTGALVR